MKDLTEKDKKSIIVSIVRNKFINDKKYTIDVSMFRITRVRDQPTGKINEAIQLSITCRSIKTKRIYPKYHFLFCHISDVDEINIDIPFALRKDCHHVVRKYIDEQLGYEKH